MDTDIVLIGSHDADGPWPSKSYYALSTLLKDFLSDKTNKNSPTTVPLYLYDNTDASRILYDTPYALLSILNPPLSLRVRVGSHLPNREGKHPNARLREAASASSFNSPSCFSPSVLYHYGPWGQILGNLPYFTPLAPLSPPRCEMIGPGDDLALAPLSQISGLAIQLPKSNDSIGRAVLFNLPISYVCATQSLRDPFNREMLYHYSIDRDPPSHTSNEYTTPIPCPILHPVHSPSTRSASDCLHGTSTYYPNDLRSQALESYDSSILSPSLLGTHVIKAHLYCLAPTEPDFPLTTINNPSSPEGQIGGYGGNKEDGKARKGEEGKNKTPPLGMEMPQVSVLYPGHVPTDKISDIYYTPTIAIATTLCAYTPILGADEDVLRA
ncbi:hypothetical protein NLI96_g12292 [Meripilus lineatus]|uniref:Uncharacterized protein n=1 Tax=Meripilus lineatus TaxID=2056292 RepID=A0AAD5UUW0_9APHY|nr:hypothetical protein NLI96_g12292 [Physisporinus lineatus]